MSKIGVAIVVAGLAGLGAAHHRSETGAAGGGRVATAAVASVLPAGDERAIALLAGQPREVVWCPDPVAPSPFGFIPTEWDAQPQLLPTTWDVRIVFASAPQQH
jgi:hypothetical protein